MVARVLYSSLKPFTERKGVPDFKAEEFGDRQNDNSKIHPSVKIDLLDEKIVFFKNDINDEYVYIFENTCPGRGDPRNRRGKRFRELRLPDFQEFA